MSYTILLSFNIYFYNYKFTYYFLYWLLKILIINNIPIINDIEKPVIAIIFIQIFRFIFCDDIIREEPITIDARTKLSESFVAKSVIHRSKLVNFISSICILILLFSKFLSIVFNCFGIDLISKIISSVSSLALSNILSTLSLLI